MAYQISRRMMDQPTSRVLQCFQPGHGYTKSNGEGQVSDDTNVKTKGIQSLRVQTNGSGSILTVDSPAVTPAYELGDAFVSLWLRVDKPENVTELRFYFASDTSFNNYYLWSLHDDMRILQPGAWTRITVAFASATSMGSPDRNAISKIRLRIQDDSSSSVTLHWNGISSLPNPSEGVVSLAFDDGHISQFTKAAPILSKHDLPATCYVIVAENFPNTTKMSFEEMLQLERCLNWEIASHMQTVLLDSSEEEAKWWFQTVRQFMVGNGFTRGVDHLAYAGGGFNEGVLRAARSYFQTARTTISYHETLPPADPHVLRNLLVLRDTTPASIAAEIDKARLEKTWLIITFHQIADNPAESIQYSTANFDSVVSDLAVDGVKVRTVGDVYNHMS